MKNKNPFTPGDRVVCIADGEFVNSLGNGHSNPPKNGCTYIVQRISPYDNQYIELSGIRSFYHYQSFAPVQDATEMEFEETEFAHYEEIAA